MAHLDWLAPALAVQAAQEVDRVRARMARIARAEVAAIRQPEPALTVQAQLRVRIARRLLVLGGLDGIEREGWGLETRGRQLGRRLLQLAVRIQADDARRALVVQRVALARHEGAIVLAPARGPF